MLSFHKYICLSLLLCFSLNAAHVNSPREELQKTTTYKVMNRLSFIVGTSFLAYSAFNYLTDSNGNAAENESLLTLSNIMATTASIITSVCAAKICATLPPITSLIGKQKSEEKSISRQEIEGFILWAQDNLLRTGMVTFIQIVGDNLPTPKMVSAASINMENWCTQNYLARNNTCGMLDEHFIGEADNYLPSVSINFVYAPPQNRTLTRIPYLTGTSDEKKLYSKIILPLLDWTWNCKTCTVNLWLDQDLESPKAFNNTMEKICEHFSQDGLPLSNLFIKNLRDLPLVQNYPRLFEANVPVYIRVDMERIAALYDAVESSDFGIYADLDLAAFAITKKVTQQLLNVFEEAPFYFVSGQKKGTAYENSFFIFTKESKPTIQHHFLEPIVKVVSSLLEQGAALEEDFIYSASLFSCFAWKSSQEDFHINPWHFMYAKSVNAKLYGSNISLYDFLEFLSELRNGSIAHHSAKKLEDMIIFLSTLQFRAFEKDKISFCPILHIPSSVAHDRQVW